MILIYRNILNLLEITVCWSIFFVIVDDVLRRFVADSIQAWYYHMLMFSRLSRKKLQNSCGDLIIEGIDDTRTRNRQTC